MVAHQVGKAMEKAVNGSRRTNAASRVVKPTGADYKHAPLEPRAQNQASPDCLKVSESPFACPSPQHFQGRGQFTQQGRDVFARVVAMNGDSQAASMRHEMNLLRT